MELWRSENPIVICFGYVHSEEKKTELKGLFSATRHIPPISSSTARRRICPAYCWVHRLYATNVTHAEMRISLLVMT